MEKSDLDRIKQLCKEKLKIKNVDKIKIHRLGGMTNRNYKVETQIGSYVIRLAGEGTKELINRRDEYICTQLANDMGIDFGLLYFNDENGTKITQYIEDAETMNINTLRNLDNMEKIADTLKRLHTSGTSIPVIFDVFEKIEEYELVLRKCKENFLWRDYEIVKNKVYNLKKEIEEMNISLTMCHNDPLCENFVKGLDKMYLVDWEYSGMNDPMWDLADVFIEAEFTSEEEALFMGFYFEEEPSEQIIRRILINKVFLDFLWSLWGKQRYSTGADFLEYANERYERTKMNLDFLSR